MTLPAGHRLGAYEILGPLGAGGMGEVYVARDGRLNRKVALKALPERLARDPAAFSALTGDLGGVLVWDRNRLPAVLERLDLATGMRVPVLRVTPPDPAGVPGVQGLFLAKDGRTYAYNVVSRLSQLFLIQGLK